MPATPSSCGGIYQPIKYRAVLRAECIALRKLALCDAVEPSGSAWSTVARLTKATHRW